MSDVVYLGRIQRVNENPESNYRHAIIEPLVQSSEDHKRWIGSIEYPLEEFPPRGSVFWHDAPKGLEIGDVRQIEIEPHPFYKGEQEKDAYAVKNHKYPMEIIDLRNIGSERDIRILLTKTGVFLSCKPLVERCVIWIQAEKWVGPVNLVRQSGTSSWVLASTERWESLKCTKIPTGAIQQVELEGTRYLLAPNQENLGQHIGFVNWEADEVLAKRVFNRLLKRDRKTAEALKITKEVFKTYMETIEHAGLVGSHLAQELAFHERIKEILDIISKNSELLDEAADVCFEIEPVKERVEERVEEEYQRRLADLETRIDEDLITKRTELVVATNSLLEKEKELVSVEEQIRVRDEELNSHVSGFEAELEKKLRELVEKPERLFAEMAITRAFTPTKAGSNTSKKRVPMRRQTNDDNTVIPIVKDPKVLMESFFKRLLGSGISPILGHSLHSTLMAGLVPVLIGPDTYDVISSYADCVSGGTLHWIQVGGSIFEPSDLLARFDPTSRCLIPHASGLLDLLVDESDALHLVVLDGFNRASVDGYLIPLLQSVKDVANGRKPRSIPLAPPGYVSEDDVYADVSTIAWNRNVLLVLCPSTGVSTLPVPSELWTHCTALNASAPTSERVPPESGSTPQVTRVTATTWKGWTEGAKEKNKPLEVIRRNPKGAGTLPRVVLDNVESINESGAALGLKDANALERAVKTSLFPYLVATEGHIDMWIQHLGIELEETDLLIGDIIRRLGE